MRDLKKDYWVEIASVPGEIHCVRGTSPRNAVEKFIEFSEFPRILSRSRKLDNWEIRLRISEVKELPDGKFEDYQIYTRGERDQYKYFHPSVMPGHYFKAIRSWKIE